LASGFGCVEESCGEEHFGCGEGGCVEGSGDDEGVLPAICDVAGEDVFAEFVEDGGCGLLSGLSGFG
jgi:hypothetical protein